MLGRILAARRGKDAYIVNVKRSIVLDCSNKGPFFSSGHASVVKYDRIGDVWSFNFLDICYKGMACDSGVYYKFERRIVQWPHDAAICRLLLDPNPAFILYL